MSFREHIPTALKLARHASGWALLRVAAYLLETPVDELESESEGTGPEPESPVRIPPEAGKYIWNPDTGHLRRVTEVRSEGCIDRVEEDPPRGSLAWRRQQSER